VRTRFEFIAGEIFFSLMLLTHIERNVDLGLCREHLGDLSVVCWKRDDICSSLPCVEDVITVITSKAIHSWKDFLKYSG